LSPTAVCCSSMSSNSRRLVLWRSSHRLHPF
jgi:hypothetical protein